MPKKTEDARVRFTDGFVFNQSFIAISSYLEAHEDSDHARMLTFTDGEWNSFDLDFNVRSIEGIERPSRILYCMGEDGRISIQKKGGPVEERIKDAGSGAGQLGYLYQIRLIGSNLYGCGVSNQIYRRTNRAWVHFDEGVIDRRSSMEAGILFSIDGSSEDNIYVVGTEGQVFHYDGSSWNRIEAPTPKGLTWVRCVSKDQVYVCGKDGVFLQRTGDTWTTVPPQPKMTGSLRCVEVFQKKIFVAGDAGLFLFDGKKLAPVSTGFDVGQGHRLHANDGVLWHFGVDKLCFFDGKKWTYVKHPDNPE